MYPSDYGYATGGGTTTDRATCLATNLSSWASTDPDVSDCTNNDYLYLKSNEWTLTPISNNGMYAFGVRAIGGVAHFNYWGSGIAPKSNAIRPVGYLISSTVILCGNGTKENPWIIST
jgi:hypothetical protein